MGRRNFLIEGVSGTGKTTVATELQRRGHHVIHGDRELAYKGDPATGAPITAAAREAAADDISFGHRHHIWDLAKVRAIIADHSRPVTFFCGGSRNFRDFIHWFDGVLVLTVDRDTLERRLIARPADEFGGVPAERAFIMRLHSTEDDIPHAAPRIDAALPLDAVIEAILARCPADSPTASPR